MWEPDCGRFKCQTEEYGIQYGSQKRVPERFWAGEWNDWTSALGRITWWQCLECTWDGGGRGRRGMTQGKEISRKLLRDSECLYCKKKKKTGKGKHFKGSICQMQQLSRCLPLFLSPHPPSLMFSIILPFWDQHSDFIWGSTLLPYSVHVTQVELNSRHFRGEHVTQA